MRVVELHPEGLLDKEASGTLTRAERDVLEAHAGRCTACECERRLRVEFAEVMVEIESPRESPSERPRESPSESEGESESERTGVRWWRHAAWVGVAALAMGVAQAAWRADEGAARAPVVRTVEWVRGAGDRAVRGKPAAVTVRVRARERERGEEEGPASLFDTANAARAHGDYASAVEGYRHLQQRYPASREARVSYATMGRMQLDRADATGALATFARYDATGGPELDEVVMSGRALALDQLGSGPDASRAWVALLEAHPDTPYAEHARLRARAGGVGLFQAGL